MFNWLSIYDRVIVSGPQRSGTTICARMIAHDTGFEFMPEERFRVYDRKRYRQLLGRTRIVVQAPTMCRWLHEDADTNTAVVMMIRNPHDIEKSQRRIKWKHEGEELANYDAIGPIALVKYDYWYRTQRRLIEHPYEIHYESLESHPLFVPAEKRKDFEPRQTSAGPTGDREDAQPRHA